MKKTTPVTDDDRQLFRDAVKGTRQIRQDTISADFKPVKQKRQLRLERENIGLAHHFSDEFHPHLEQDGPMRYVCSDVSKFELKKLRRGDYPPEILLDVHGLSQQQAKAELSALLSACERQNLHVACVMHGIGKHILKERVPAWLAQHAKVRAFHQAPREWGGNSALLVLLDIEER